jgi:hypothetical protein
MASFWFGIGLVFLWAARDHIKAARALPPRTCQHRRRARELAAFGYAGMGAVICGLALKAAP